ncbi:MAG: putative capsid protein [CRESS virus sp. ctczB4]|uniref:Putative capsid protein n=1 Tax=CRESS virus sp. ctczB4 TaxID=2656682 RepID=A0A5Q2W9F2_9VIRU|nr:MAG: putative capsid protein [CRESS virus sp. ctczB4]
MPYGPHFPNYWQSQWGAPPPSMAREWNRRILNNSIRQGWERYNERVQARRSREASLRAHDNWRAYRDEGVTESFRRARYYTRIQEARAKKPKFQAKRQRTISGDSGYESANKSVKMGTLGAIAETVTGVSGVARAGDMMDVDTWEELGSKVGSSVGTTIGLDVGGFVGGAAGEMIGRGLGSVIGKAGDYASSLLSPKNNMPKAGFAPFNSGKSSVSVKGKIKVSSRTKKVRVSKSLREKVQKVIKGSMPQGVYRFCHQGFIGLKLTDSTASVENVMTSGDDIGGTVEVSRGVPALLNSKQWYYGYCTFQNTATTVQFFQPAGLFEYFTPTKILNAASVLFNRKAMPAEGDVLNTNNMLVSTNNTGTSQRPQKYKLHINNAYVNLSFKNCAARVMIVDFYVCTLKQKTLVPAGLQFITEAIVTDAETITGGSSGMPVYKARDTVDREEQINYSLTSLMFDPAMSPTFRARFKYEKITMTIQPGETLTKMIQGPRNYDLDYSKIVNTNAGAPDSNLLYKPTTVVCFASVRPDAQYLIGGINDNATLGGSASVIKGQLNVIACPISIQQEQVYSLSMPDVTGFQYQAIQTVGEPQVLNSRFNQTRIYLNDRRIAAGQGTTSYAAVNEENPAVNSTISAGSFIY